MANTVGKYAKTPYPVGQYPGGRVVQAAYGEHTQVANSLAADTLDICKVPGNALVLKAEVYVGSTLQVVADITKGTAASATLFDGAPVQLNSAEDVIVRLTSVGASDFPAAGVIRCVVYYLTDQPKPV